MVGLIYALSLLATRGYFADAKPVYEQQASQLNTAFGAPTSPQLNLELRLGLLPDVPVREAVDSAHHVLPVDTSSNLASLPSTVTSDESEGKKVQASSSAGPIFEHAWTESSLQVPHLTTPPFHEDLPGKLQHHLDPLRIDQGTSHSAKEASRKERLKAAKERLRQSSSAYRAEKLAERTGKNVIEVGKEVERKGGLSKQQLWFQLLPEERKNARRASKKQYNQRKIASMNKDELLLFRAEKAKYAYEYRLSLPEEKRRQIPIKQRERYWKKKEEEEKRKNKGISEAITTTNAATGEQESSRETIVTGEAL